MDPVAKRDGHRAGQGVERGGIETGEEDIENFIARKQARARVLQRQSLHLA